MAAIIIERENHPDRGIDRVIGPYPDWETAKWTAMDLESSKANINGRGNRRHNYQAIDLTPPEEA
jgi:hypothetical protein